MPEIIPGFCGVKDVPGERAEGECKWPEVLQPITYWLGKLPILSESEWKAVFEESTAAWMEVCGMQFRQVSDAREANLVVFSGREDGPQSTLAWCELPCGIVVGRNQVIRMKLDAQEPWVTSNPKASQIDAVPVVSHEVGHGIGLYHIDGPVALLNPTYNARVRKPLQPDITAAVKLYGTAKNPKGPGDKPPKGNPTSVSVLIEIGGRRFRGAGAWET